MSYTILRPETLTHSGNAEEILAERLVMVLNEKYDEEVGDSGETVVGFFRCIVADADGK